MGGEKKIKKTRGVEGKKTRCGEDREEKWHRHGPGVDECVGINVRGLGNSF